MWLVVFSIVLRNQIHVSKLIDLIWHTWLLDQTEGNSVQLMPPKWNILISLKLKKENKGFIITNNFCLDISYLHYYKNQLGWSTCVLVYFSGHLDHVMYLKMRRELLLCKAEQIQKIALKISFDELNVKIIITLWICSVLHYTYPLLSLRLITWAKS